MSICGETTLFKDAGTKGCAATRLCRTYDTDCCHELRVGELRDLIKAGRGNFFATFTLIYARGRDPIKACTRLLKHFRKLMLRAKRRFKCPIEYIWWTEAHKTGWPHLHVVIRAAEFYTEREAKDLWCSMTGAYQVDVTPATDPSGIARYIETYTKDGPDKFGTHKRSHHSRNWRVIPNDKPVKLEQLDGPWSWSDRHIGYYVAIWQDRPGFHLNRGQRFCYYGLDTS